MTALNHRTRDAVIATIRETVAAGISDGKSPAEVGDDLETALSGATLDNGQPAFDEYRAEMIARTEMTSAYNDAAIGSYRDLGVTEVTAMDGDQDEECAARDGQTFTLDEAAQIEDHPNGTLDWIPVVEYDEPKAAPLTRGERQSKALALVEQMTNTDAAETAALSQMSQAMTIMAQSLANMPTPEVTVNVPPATVNVTVPDFPPFPDIPAPQVTVNVPEQRPVNKTVERDSAGRITAVHEEPA